MNFVDIFAWWLISPTDFGPTLYVAKSSVGPTKLSQALCVSDQIEETREDNESYYARLLGATFCSGPPGIRGLAHSSPPPFSGSLKHDCQCDSGSQLGQWLPSPLSRHHIPARLGRLRSPGPSFLPCMEGPGTGLKQRLREEGGGHIWSGISFPCFLSAGSEVRGETQGADKYWKWRLIFLRGEKCRLPLWGSAIN